MTIQKTATVPQPEKKLTIKQLVTLITELTICLGEQLDSAQLSFGRLLTPQDEARRKLKRDIYWDQWKELEAMVEARTNSNPGASQKKKGVPRQPRDGKSRQPQRTGKDLPLSQNDREKIAGRCVAYWHRLKTYAPAEEVPDLGAEVTKSFILGQTDEELLGLERDFLGLCDVFAPLVDLDDLDACLAALQRGVSTATLTPTQQGVVERVRNLSDLADKSRLLRDQTHEFVAQLRQALEGVGRRRVQEYLKRRQAAGVPQKPKQQGAHPMTEGQREDDAAAREQLREQGIDPDGNVGEQLKQLKDDKAAAESKLVQAQEHLAQRAAVPDSLVQLSTKLGTTPENLASTIEAALTAAKKKLEELDGQLQQTKAALKLANNGRAEAARKLGEKEKELAAIGKALAASPVAVLQQQRTWWGIAGVLGTVAVILAISLIGTRMALSTTRDKLRQEYEAVAEAQPQLAEPTFEVYNPPPITFDE